MKKAIRILLTVFIIITLISGTAVYFYLNSFFLGDGGDGGSLIESKGVKSGEPFNVLLMGVDVGTVGSKNSPKRSDTMIVVNYNPKTAEVAMVSIPRDTRVKINGGYEKINAANVRGGTELAIQCVEELLGIDINYYVEINYEGFREFVDAIGGVDVVIPYNMDYDDPQQDLHIHFKKGEKVHLDGKKAEKFVRWRKNNDGTGYAEGDLGRIRTQQEFMVKVLEKVKSPSMLFNLPSILKILPKYIETNMDPVTMLALSKDIPKINADSIEKYTLAGESKIIDGIWYFVYNPEESRDMIDVLGGDVPEKEKSVDRSSIKVQILNGSGINGAASIIKEELEKKGYKVSSIGNISGVKFTTSHIVDKTLKGDSAKQLSSDLDISHIEKDQDSLARVDLLVILGLDANNMLKNLKN